MTLDEAVAALKLHARQLEAVQIIAGAITKAKDIDNLTQEAEQRRAARQKDVDAATAVLEQKRADIAACEKELAAIKEKSRIAVVDANTKAAAKAADAERAYNHVVEQAKIDAASILQPVKDEAAACQKHVDDLTAMAKTLDAQITAKTAELSSINAQIEKARDLLKGFIGQ